MKKVTVIHGVEVEESLDLLKQTKLFIYTWSGYAENGKIGMVIEPKTQANPW